MLLSLLAVGAQAADLHARVLDKAGKPVADTVIVAVPLDAKNALRAQVPSASVDQVDKQFVPYVMPILVGSTLRFPNSDNIRHQVYSFSPAKKFELPLYAGTDAQPVLFDKAGVVVLGCNIHDWMIGYIYVSETPFFAKTDATGGATVPDLPPGAYRVRVWHPSMEGEEASTERTLTLSADAQSEEWRLVLKPSARVSRMSGGGSASYP
jgi:plastocyanin